MKKEELRLGVEFSQDFLRFALCRVDQGLVLKKLVEWEATGLCDSQGMLTDKAAATATLKKIVTQEGWKDLTTIFSVPTDRASFTWSALPDIPARELRDVARFKVKRKANQNPEDLTAAVCETKSESGDSLIVAAPKSLVAQRAEVLTKAGLAPVAAEVEVQTALRLVDRQMRVESGTQRESSLTISLIGPTRIHFAVIQNGRLQFVRSIRLGAQRLENTVAQAADISLAEAREVLHDPQTWLVDRRYLRRIKDGELTQTDVGEAIEAYAKEFRRILHYFRSLYSERSYSGILDRLYLLGDLTQVRGFCDAMADLAGVPGVAVRPAVGLGIEVSSESFKAMSQDESQFAVALGLASSNYGMTPQIEEESHEQDFTWTRAATRVS